MNQCLEFSSPLPSDAVTAAEAVVDLAVSPNHCLPPGLGVLHGPGLSPGRQEVCSQAML